MNPYEILGINKNASKEEIQQAYRKLAKKYHPDQYGNNPLRDLAEQKMREINEAYDYLMKNNNSQSYNSSNYNNSSNSYSSNDYASIRADIDRGNISSAEQKLNSINVRNAEWYYLMGRVNYSKGWYDVAYNYFNNAHSLDPSNFEYRDALNKMSSNNNSYRKPYYSERRSDPDMCRICGTLYCMDCCCECCGGDFISCC
ncbi:TPA: J domain-containing protein [Clostridium botulinum]|uniref:J domain-containing protein n=1 Tax=Clostridium botulinum TaxID=1491 RepID=A0ABC8CSE5_CLOBO|nr:MULTISPECIES: DnaJ domain-containing protein [Clostridium]AUM94101.1 molecular chaperone DnaJ [Clostridium sporogenes]AVQ37701.1 J domain-containing protein [Clostridium botulinum]AVQ51525.1 J domain-containing protein [Clostridium botulinum]MCW6111526.1 DnaJ domain-containing protein [Clostridium sporogenes]HBJ2614956.1 J domain-containing protein [Clostridium botulinum]